jgi:hypothetical protein
MNTRTNKLAWKIRRNLAAKRGCDVMEINWGHCWHKADRIIEDRKEKAIRRTAKRYIALKFQNDIAFQNNFTLVTTLISVVFTIAFVLIAFVSDITNGQCVVFLASGMLISTTIPMFLVIGEFISEWIIERRG